MNVIFYVIMNILNRHVCCSHNCVLIVYSCVFCNDPYYPKIKKNTYLLNFIIAVFLNELTQILCI